MTTTRPIVPRMGGDGSVGVPEKHWGKSYIDEGHFDSVKLNGGDLGEYLAESTGYGIVSGCEPSISGLTVTVGAGTVHLADGTRKEMAQTSVTLDAADPTNPRIDLVYINADGEVAKITGTAAASPSAPTLPTGAIKVADVVVEQGASTGTIVDNRDYGPKLNKPEGFFLGAFFTRTTSSASGADRVTNFFASQNGVDWKHINKNVSLGNGGDYPYWGGDPSLIYYKGKFYVAVSQQNRTADFLIYTSTDFVNWQGKKINLGLTDANRAVWAPDFFIGKDGSLYVSLSYSENWPTFDIVITRCTDIDSLTFSTPVPITLWDGIDTTNLSTDKSHIDSSIVLKDNEYYMAVKNEVKNKIEVFKSTDLYSGWKKITSSVFNENTEGPTIKYINGIWHIWFDVFATKNTGLESAYIHALSNDLINFFDYEELSHDDETYEHNIRHGSIIYINNNSNAGYVVKQLDDFTTTETTQLYCGMNMTTPIRTDVGELIDLQGTYKENHYYVIDDLVLYPYCDFRVMRPLLIKNISNPLNVNNVKFFLYDSASYLKINTIEGANCNYVATPSRFESFALKLEKQRGNTSLTRIDDNPVYFMSIGNSATTGYVHLFDMTAENWCSSDTIFYLESTSAYSHNAIYHVRCQKYNNIYTVYGNLLKSITDSHIKLYAVKYNDKISIYAEHPAVTMIHRMSIITKGQYIGWTEINIAMPNTIVESLSELGGTVTEIVS